MRIWWTVKIAVMLCYGVALVGVFAECGPAQNLTNPGTLRILNWDHDFH